MTPEGPLGSRSRPRKLLHVLFWTGLFYLLTVAIAKLVEYLNG